MGKQKGTGKGCWVSERKGRWASERVGLRDRETQRERAERSREYGSRGNVVQLYGEWTHEASGIHVLFLPSGSLNSASDVVNVTRGRGSRGTSSGREISFANQPFRFPRPRSAAAIRPNLFSQSLDP